MRGGRQAHGVTTKANGQGATAQPTEQQLGQELRFEERTEGVASGTRIRFQARGSPLMNSFLGEWREGKVRPYTGKCPARPAGKPGDCFVKEHLRRSLPRHSIPAAIDTGRPVCVFQGMAESFTPMWLKSKSKTKPEPGSTASRRSAPTQVEERDGRIAPFSSFAMSSGRLFLDRVARQHCPSPLHRHTQINMTFSKTRAEGDISTLPGRGHFYFALTG